MYISMQQQTLSHIPQHQHRTQIGNAHRSLPNGIPTACVSLLHVLACSACRLIPDTETKLSLVPFTVGGHFLQGPSPRAASSSMEHCPAEGTTLGHLSWCMRLICNASRLRCIGHKRHAKNAVLLSCIPMANTPCFPHRLLRQQQMQSCLQQLGCAFRPCKFRTMCGVPPS